MICDVKNCKDVAKLEVKFDGAAKGIDKKFLCEQHYNISPFDKFVVDVTEIKND